MIGSATRIFGQKPNATQRLIFGSAIQARHILVDGGFRDAVLRECDTLTPELEFKWDYIEGEPGQYNMRPAEQIADFARTNGKKLHGHALIWHKGTPAWVIQLLGEKPDWELVRRFFTKAIPPFNDVTDSWDVVNEPIAIGQRDDGLRASAFLQAFGAGYIERAFEEAAELAPQADLYLNEYGLLHNDPESADKRTAVITLLERLVAKGVPISGFGLQGHLELSQMDAFDQIALERFLRKIADLGLKIRISELDVYEDVTDIPVEIRDARVSGAVGRLLEIVVENPALIGITCWGLSDRYSWLPPYSASAGLNRGLPLDSNLREKPMYRAVRNALQKS